MFSCRLKLAPNWRTLEVRPRVAASPLRSEEAQGVVPLLHRARASETTIRIGNGKPHRVLRHDQRWRRLGQQLQGGPILAFEVVWRVEEDDIGGVARRSNPSDARFSRIVSNAWRSRSRKNARRAPRLRASMPTAPAPA